MRGRSGRLGAAVALAGATLLLLATAGVDAAIPAAASAAVSPVVASRPATGPVPAVSGPVTGGLGVPVVFPTSFDLAQVGYEESEFFVSGTAASFVADGTLGADGRWKVTPGSTAPYTTRIVVRRPVDPRRFNGTVVVEWLNVSGGVDADPDWTEAHNELIRDGFAWVGVSAQSVGVNALKTEDAARYATLSHPGDSFSYDIFSQAGRAVRADAALVLSGLRPRRVLAAGESQSAGRLVTYIDALGPVAHAFDGYLVHSRFSTGTPLSQAPQATVNVPNPLAIRSDLRTPGLRVRDRDRRGRQQPRRPPTRHQDVPTLGGGRHLPLRLVRLGHRPRRHRQRPGRGGQPGRQPRSADGHPAWVQLQPPDQHRRRALGPGCRRLLAEPVGCPRDPTADRTSPPDDELVARSSTPATRTGTCSAACARRWWTRR